MITISPRVAWVLFVLSLALLCATALLALSLGDERKANKWLRSPRDVMYRMLREPNPYAHLLGKVVEAKVYEASEWERVVVVAVSWRGSVCVQLLSDMKAQGRWIHKDVVPRRLHSL